MELELEEAKQLTDAAAEADTRHGEQYVTFLVGDELFAFPMESVREIIRMPEIVRVPLSPPALQGVANLRGQILPIVSLRSKFAFDAKETDSATRVIVVDHGTTVGFIVDSVASVLTVQPGQREDVGNIQASVDTDLLSAMLKGLPNDAIAMVLDVRALVQTGELRAAAARSFAETKAKDVENAEATDEKQLVSFVVAEQEYAFPIEEVQEIVQVPSQMTQVPNAQAHVLGVMTLRDRLIPLVSLRQMFQLPFEKPTLEQRIVITSLGNDAGVGGTDSVVGIVMDSVNEVLRVPGKCVDEVPPFLRARHQGEEIDSICRLDDGKRLVCVLSVAKLFQHPTVRDAVMARDSMLPEAVMNETIQQASSKEGGDEEQLVVFHLAGEEYGVTIDSVQEIIRMPEVITRVPHAVGSLAGIVNVRGEVLPIVDFRRRFQLGAVPRDDRQRVVVLSMKGTLTGFIVDSVAQVLKVLRSRIEPVPALSEEQANAVRHVANLQEAKRMILVLEPERLFDAAELAALRSVRHSTPPAAAA